MINETDIKTLFNSLNIPIFRGHAPIGTPVPYLVYVTNYSENLYADNQTYLKIPSYELTLYNDNPDISVRTNIETILTTNSIPYSYDEADDTDESLYISYYYFGGL